MQCHAEPLAHLSEEYREERALLPENGFRCGKTSSGQSLGAAVQDSQHFPISFEYCEDDYQEVRKCPSLEELVHDSDAETTLDGIGFYKENT